MTTPTQADLDEAKKYVLGEFKNIIDEIHSRIPNVSRAVLQSVYLQGNADGIKSERARNTKPKDVTEQVTQGLVFDHPCKETCSGWKQGFEAGEKSSEEKLRVAMEALRKISDSAAISTDGSGSAFEFEQLYNFWHDKAIERRTIAEEALAKIQGDGK